ncbi:MAG: hypothetical protein FWD73_17145, partial [Polyangiaceae bacterium]|nr:hypothetical protein [Polyangiaceae bacterium]
MQRIFLTTCLVGSLAAASVTVSHVARADDVAKTEAESRFTEGLDLADQSKYEQARVKFLQAATVLQTPSVMFNLARSEQMTGHDVEAIEHYRAFFKSSKFDSRITDKKREKAKEYIADLLTKVGQVEIDAPDGARISVNGKVLDEMPSE